LNLLGLERSCIAIGDECFQASRRSDQSVWLSSMSDDESLIVKESPFLALCVFTSSCDGAVLMPLMARRRCDGRFLRLLSRFAAFFEDA
jgi:hypothetical protein